MPGMTWADLAPWMLSDLLLPLVIVAVAAYFCGCFNGAVIVSKYILRDDVRTHGSGNAGLTNFYRTFGGPLTIVVILLDVVKAVVAVLLGVWIFGSVLGHGAQRWVSLGSIWAGASFPFATWFVYHDWILLLLGIFIGGLVVWKHRGNLGRILRGTESKFSLHHKKDEGASKP